MGKLRGLSLFSNVGIAETYLEEVGAEILLANDIDSKRMLFYKHLYPKCETIIGDITNPKIQNEIIQKAKDLKVNLIMATPPCQGMSLAGKRDPLDVRNQLITYSIEIIKKIKPKYIFLENVPEQQKTKIKYKNKIIFIPDYIKKELEEEYYFNSETLIKCMEYSVPQMRKRNIFLLTRKDQKIKWSFPKKDNKIITLFEAIGHLPSVDPLVKEGYEKTISLFPEFEKKKEIALRLSKFHFPPTHAERHIIAMRHTPSGCTAFDNQLFYPKKQNGEKVSGHYNTYRRHSWDKPSRTIIMNNGVISSLCCVHPGRKISESDIEKNRIYSDPRVFTLLELFIVTTLPIDWDPPEWANEGFIRKVIGEGIPPLLVKKIFFNLTKK
jgi:DNA (cytosine-5)-methyltransferase 1